MDLRLYYQKIRETESRIADPFPVVVSIETPDGGRAGTCTEVSRAIAAKLIVDGTAQVAPADQARKFRDQQAESKRLADEIAEAAKVQVTVLSQAELSRLKNTQRAAKDQV